MGDTAVRLAPFWGNRPLPEKEADFKHEGYPRARLEYYQTMLSINSPLTGECGGYVRGQRGR